MPLSATVTSAVILGSDFAVRNRHSRSDFGVGSRFGPRVLEWGSGFTPSRAQTPISRNICHGAISSIVLCALPVWVISNLFLYFGAAETQQLAGDDSLN